MEADLSQNVLCTCSLMFWGSRTSSYNDVTFWLKLASTFYALFYFIPGSWYDSHVACSDFFLGVLFLQLFAVLQFLMTCHQQTSLLHLISLRPLRGVDVTASVGGPQVFSPDFHRPSIAFSRTPNNYFQLFVHPTIGLLAI